MKAILILDMPSNCGECKIYMNNGNSYWCKATGIDTTGLAMPASCPLKPLPQKKDTNGRYIENQWIETAYEVGWNGCLDEILGEEE